MEKNKKYFYLILLITFILSVISLFLVFESAGAEPFIVFESEHAWTQLVCSTAVIIFLIEELIWIVLLIFKGENRIKYFLLMLWILFVLYWMIHVPIYYISDVEKFQKMFNRGDVSNLVSVKRRGYSSG